MVWLQCTTRRGGGVVARAAEESREARGLFWLPPGSAVHRAAGSTPAKPRGPRGDAGEGVTKRGPVFGQGKDGAQNRATGAPLWGLTAAGSLAGDVEVLALFAPRLLQLALVGVGHAVRATDLAGQRGELLRAGPPAIGSPLLSWDARGERPPGWKESPQKCPACSPGCAAPPGR